jgi:hypothetical protein
MKNIYALLTLIFIPFFIFSQNLISINPSSANNGQTLNVTIIGNNTDFIQASGTTIGFTSTQGVGNPIINSTTTVNDTMITANITVPNLAHTGNYTLFTNNFTDGYLSLNNSFYVNGNIPPALTSPSPSSANSGQTLNVTITGMNTHFSQASTTCGINSSYGLGNPIVNSKTIINDTLITANITIPTTAYTDNYTIFTNNSIDGYISLDNSFYIVGNLPPTITSINPSGGNSGQTLNITITGSDTHFNQASSTTSLNFSSIQGIGNPIVNSKTILNDSVITANITIPANASIGAYNANIYNSNTGSLVYDFFVFDNCLSLYSTSYDLTQNNFTLTIDSITSNLATAFYWDFGDGNTSTNVTPSHSFAQDTTYNVCLTIVNSSGDSCTYCHFIGKDSTGIVLKKSGFSINVVHHDGSITVGVEQTEEKELEPIAIYPNPFDSYIRINTKKEEKLKLTIYDIASRKISQTNFVNSIKIDTENLSKGIYIYQIKSSDEILKSGKIIK